MVAHKEEDKVADMKWKTIFFCPEQLNMWPCPCRYHWQRQRHDLWNRVKLLTFQTIEDLNPCQSKQPVNSAVLNFTSPDFNCLVGVYQNECDRPHHCHPQGKPIFALHPLFYQSQYLPSRLLKTFQGWEIKAWLSESESLAKVSEEKESSKKHCGEFGFDHDQWSSSW